MGATTAFSGASPRGVQPRELVTSVGSGHSQTRLRPTTHGRRHEAVLRKRIVAAIKAMSEIALGSEKDEFSCSTRAFHLAVQQRSPGRTSPGV
jgi:hypothetical protein